MLHDLASLVGGRDFGHPVISKGAEPVVYLPVVVEVGQRSAVADDTSRHGAHKGADTGGVLLRERKTA
jgi:hypothetical protein